MAIGNSWVCLGRYISRGMSRQRINNNTFSAPIYRINYNANTLYHKGVAFPTENRYIQSWNDLFGADAGNATNVQKALKSLELQAERFLKIPNHLRLAKACALDSGIASYVGFNVFWSRFRQIGGSYLFRQWSHEMTSAAVDSFQYGFNISKNIHTDVWCKAVYNDSTKEIYISGNTNLQSFNSSSMNQDIGAAFPHNVADLMDYDRVSPFSQEWNNTAITLTWKSWPGSGERPDEKARIAAGNYTRSFTDNNPAN